MSVFQRYSRLGMKIKKASCSEKTQIKREKSKENQKVFTFCGAGIFLQKSPRRPKTNRNFIFELKQEVSVLKVFKHFFPSHYFLCYPFKQGRNLKIGQGA